ncbi:hypothetical protein MCOR27_004326 [Pyricularia oryzae]|uniref:Uncharacterized protein n=1 Tax=Pyricularia grisea TaxID=148305 RepID=A0ABQ8N5F8_PYRGI|nr:hypothetical protein MCOR01_003092 [Pyricularia oryzae]KAI6291250.1 hypothetical protein MCOR33_010741 [Pyricularia grisea]KAH9432624.1 hypothetical protein MCOR02_007314 [Pyricularia oryzae]KAI6257106.1 hypothetical protein MCOR19_006489 [Pyricularia oryzae]KAI6264735.1 hypothetical protein MCOR26_011159 [Pyricularia oryzae]
MGLPLYIAPVESDVPPRSAPKSPPAHPRSAIRRRRHDVSGVEARRRAGLAAHIAAVHDYAFGNSQRWVARRGGRLATPPRDNTVAAAAGHTAMDSPSDTQPPDADQWRAATRRFREPSNPPSRRSAGLDDRAASVMAERWANLHTRASPDLAARVQMIRTAMDSTHRSVRTSRDGISRFPRARTSRSRDESLELPPIRQEVRVVVEPSHTLEPDLSTMGGLVGQRPPRSSRNSRREPSQSTPMDGLGDRNRSLSPEAENPWHTIVSTLTPDPQPPSASSSFASTSASFSTSTTQSAGTGRSSATSVTGRDTRMDDVEQNCESACENSDTEEDEDDESSESALLPFFSRPELADDAHMDQFMRSVRSYSSETGDRNRGTRTYADVIGNTADRTNPSGSSADNPGELMGEMQRIVRRLATREDIPDEWWAEVGLSRTLSRASG